MPNDTQDIEGRWAKAEGFALCVVCDMPTNRTLDGTRLHKMCLPTLTDFASVRPSNPPWPYAREPEPEAVRWNALMTCLIGLYPERPPLSVRLAAAKAADAIVQDWFQR